MAELQYGPQILLEAQALYQAMKADKTSYNPRAISELIEQYMPSLVDTPRFRREVSSLLLQRTGWGRRVFINWFFDLISEHFGIDAPHDVAPVSQWVAAPAPPLIAMVDHGVLDLDLGDLEITPLSGASDSPPWD